MRKFIVTLVAEGVNVIAAFVLILAVFPNSIWLSTNIGRQVHYASLDPEMAVFGPSRCSDKCVVTYSAGGWIRAFTNMAKLIRAYDLQLVVDGPCMSACAIMADFARPNVCITKNASFHFHMAFRIDGSRVAPPATVDIIWWVRRHGGFPYDGYVDMEFAEAKPFWPVCVPEGKTDRIARM